MESAENVQQPQASAAPTPTSDRPPERLVRHVFWKYPVLSLVLLVVVVVLAATVGSPNWPRDSIAGVTKADPGGSILACTQELDGTSTSTSIVLPCGMPSPTHVPVPTPAHAVTCVFEWRVRSGFATWLPAVTTAR